MLRDVACDEKVGSERQLIRELFFMYWLNENGELCRKNRMKGGVKGVMVSLARENIRELIYRTKNRVSGRPLAAVFRGRLRVW